MIEMNHEGDNNLKVELLMRIVSMNCAFHGALMLEIDLWPL